MADVLQPLSRENRPRLLEELQRDLPNSIVVIVKWGNELFGNLVVRNVLQAYQWLRMQTEWEDKIPGIKVHVLCPDGDWSDAAVVAFTDGLVQYIRTFHYWIAIN
jgi:hypothetical protein